MIEEKIFELFRKTINNSFWLQRDNRDYLLTENGVLYRFVAPSRQCFAFRIDDSGKKIMLSADVESEEVKLFQGSPPAGVAKMCDAIFAVFDEGRDYIISVEIKTGNKDEYKKQISNGWRFCEWIINLLKDYNHYPKEKMPVHLGLLVWRVEDSTGVTKQILMSKRYGYEKKESHRDMDIFESFDSIISLKTLLESARKIS